MAWSCNRMMYIPRIHPAPIETCGCVADYHEATGKLTVWMTSQAPHVHRTLFAHCSGLPEHRIRIISPDIGGGFGNKVPIYPGYVCAVVASITTGKPVKWIEDRSENLVSTGFGVTIISRPRLLLIKMAQSKLCASIRWPIMERLTRLLSPRSFPLDCSTSAPARMIFKNAFVEVDAVHTNKAPGGIAYRCSFRVTEASYMIERDMDTLAYKLGKGPGGITFSEFHQTGSVPLSFCSRLDV